MSKRCRMKIKSRNGKTEQCALKRKLRVKRVSTEAYYRKLKNFKINFTIRNRQL